MTVQTGFPKATRRRPIAAPRGVGVAHLPPAAETLGPANAVRAEHARAKAEALVAVASGELTVLDVVEAAKDPASPLRSLRLKALLEAKPGLGTERAGRMVDALIARSGRRPISRGQATLKWLHTAKTSTTDRPAILVELLSGARGLKRELPWPEWPWRPLTD